MNYRIEHDNSVKREPSGNYNYRIYDGDRLIARFWHDFRGDEQGIDFVDGPSEGSPFGRVSEFIEGGGVAPLLLSGRAMVYLKERQLSFRGGDT